MSEHAVAAHYAQAGLEQRILDALRSAGADPDHLAPEQLAPVEEFHVGGRTATAELAERLELRPGLRVLDVGCGVGGPARYLAHAYDVQVSGIDLTDDYVRTATALARRVGLAERTRFVQGDATDLPFPDGAFDRVCMLHVGMNIEDKAALFAQVHRVLADGGLFGLYDVMRAGPGEIAFPVPWASEPGTSALATLQDYRDLLGAAGLTVRAERDRTEFGLDVLRTMQAGAAQNGIPAVGLHLLMGPDTGVKIANLVDALARGVVAPVELIAQR